MTWADFITDDIAARIQTGRRLPKKLSLQALCDEYQVSMTPVRKAVRGLLDRGLLVRDKNNRLQPHRMEVNRGPRRQVSLVPQPPRDVFDVVAKNLVLESLKGEARFLRESLMARQYGVSRTVLRRVFHHLAGAGIIDHIPRRGWQLRAFNKEDLAAFLQVREMLELKALQLATGRLDPAVLKNMLKRNVVKKNKGKPRMDNSLHNYLIEQSGNRYIKDFFEHYGKYYEILFVCEDMDRQSAAMAARQHRKILKALLQRNLRQAKQALSEHIRTNHTVLNTQPELILKLARTGKRT